MLGFLRSNPVKDLRRRYMAKMKEARDEQRRGDVVRAAELTAEAEEIGKELDRAEAERNGRKG